MRISKILLLAILLTATITLSAQVAINTDGTQAEQSSMLDVSSTTKGVLIPRMSASQRDAISNPATGLMVFVNTDQCFYYYDGSNWIKLLNNDSNDDDWTISGDDVYVSLTKKVGIGATSPIAKLDIRNTSDTKPLRIENSYSGSSNAYGQYTIMSGSSSGLQYGCFSSISNGGDGNHYGSYNDVTGSGNGKLFGSYSRIFNNGSGNHYGFYTGIQGSGAGDKIGLYASVTNNGGDSHYGVRTLLGTDGTGQQYGVFNELINTGAGHHYGVYNRFTGTTSANIYGLYNLVLATGDGTHYGVYNYIAGSGSGDKYGLYSGFSSSAGGKHYGIYIDAPGGQNYAAVLSGKTHIKDKTSGITVSDKALATIDATNSDTALYVINTPSSGDNTYSIISNIKGADNGEKHAVHNIIENTGQGAHVGVFNKITGNAVGYQYGVYNNIDNTGNYPHYGVFNKLYGSGTGSFYGNYDTITGSGGGTHYGNYTTLTGSGSGDKVGSFIDIPASTGGVHYGFKCDVTGSTNYAGYFDGRMYVSDNVGIGVPSPTVKLDVAGDAQFTNAGADAVVDIESTSGDAALNLKAAGSGDLAQVKLYNASTLKASIGYDQANYRIFISEEGQRIVYFDNGNINPQNHKQQNLGYNGMAWNNIYYDDLFAQGAAAFVSRNVSKELVNFPPKEKKPGSFDYKTDRGEVELDPASLPAGLHDDNSILTDEMVSYNYKANYEQQLLINKQADKIVELEKKLESQSKMIEQLLQKLSGK